MYKCLYGHILSFLLNRQLRMKSGSYDCCCCCSLVFHSCTSLCNPMDCSTPTPGAYSNSCPSNQWCHPTISSSVSPLSSHLQSFPTLGSILGASRVALLPEASQKEPISLSFLVFRGYPQSLIFDPLFHFQNQHHSIISHFTDHSWEKCFDFKISCD